MKYYQLLLTECIKIQNEYKKLKNMRKTLRIMKSNIRQLKLNRLKSEIQQNLLYIQKADWIRYMKGV